jgi:hypothetical protein
MSLPRWKCPVCLEYRKDPIHVCPNVCRDKVCRRCAWQAVQVHSSRPLVGFSNKDCERFQTLQYQPNWPVRLLSTHVIGNLKHKQIPINKHPQCPICRKSRRMPLICAGTKRKLDNDGVAGTALDPFVYSMLAMNTKPSEDEENKTVVNENCDSSTLQCIHCDVTSDANVACSQVFDCIEARVPCPYSDCDMHLVINLSVDTQTELQKAYRESFVTHVGTVCSHVNTCVLCLQHYHWYEEETHWKLHDFENVMKSVASLKNSLCEVDVQQLVEAAQLTSKST